MDPESLHLAIIDSYVAAWHNGELSVTDKRKLIEAENARYHARPDALAWRNFVAEFAFAARLVASE